MTENVGKILSEFAVNTMATNLLSTPSNAVVKQQC